MNIVLTTLGVRNTNPVDSELEKGANPGCSWSYTASYIYEVLLKKGRTLGSSGIPQTRKLPQMGITIFLST